MPVEQLLAQRELSCTGQVGNTSALGMIYPKPHPQHNSSTWQRCISHTRLHAAGAGRNLSAMPPRH